MGRGSLGRHGKVDTMTRRGPTPTPDTPPGSIARYRDRIFDDKRIDPYEAKGKFSAPTVCGDCRAVFEGGRWQWASAPENAHVARCPACQRIQDKLPAGEITLDGPFFDAHREELLQLVQNEGAHERGEHPLHRIMRIDESGGKAVVLTTDIHTPRRLGRALESAYRGDLELRYGADEYSVRAHWRR